MQVVLYHIYTSMKNMQPTLTALAGSFIIVVIMSLLLMITGSLQVLAFPMIQQMINSFQIGGDSSGGSGGAIGTSVGAAATTTAK